MPPWQWRRTCETFTTTAQRCIRLSAAFYPKSISGIAIFSFSCTPRYQDQRKSGSITIKNFQEFSRFHRHSFISPSLYVDLYLIDHNLITPQPTQPLGFPILPTASADPITYLSFPITHASHVLTIHITIKPPSTLTMLPSTTTGGCSERQGSG